jgi:hypothetical protein
MAIFNSYVSSPEGNGEHNLSQVMLMEFRSGQTKRRNFFASGVFCCVPAESKFSSQSTNESQHSSADWDWFVKQPSTLWWTNSLQWKMAIEIVDFPIKNGGSFHCYVSSPEGMSDEWIQGIDRAVEELGEWLRKVRWPLELAILQSLWTPLEQVEQNGAEEIRVSFLTISLAVSLAGEFTVHCVRLLQLGLSVKRSTAPQPLKNYH